MLIKIVIEKYKLTKMYWNVLKLNKNIEKQQNSRQKLSGQHKINIDNEFRNYYTQICDLKLYINIQCKCR